jgi:hypothetical protein
MVSSKGSMSHGKKGRAKRKNASRGATFSKMHKAKVK